MRKLRKLWLISLVALLLGGLLDGILTYFLVTNLGGREANPFIDILASLIGLALALAVGKAIWVLLFLGCQIALWLLLVQRPESRVNRIAIRTSISINLLLAGGTVLAGTGIPLTVLRVLIPWESLPIAHFLLFIRVEEFSHVIDWALDLSSLVHYLLYCLLLAVLGLECFATSVLIEVKEGMRSKAVRAFRGG